MKSLKLNKTNKVFRRIFLLIFLILSLSLVLYGGYLNLYEGSFKTKNSTLNQLKIDGFNLKLLPLNQDISAFSYLVGELKSGKILIEKNSKIHLFPASLSKLLTAMIVIDKLPLDEKIIMDEYSLSAEGNEIDFKVGEELKVNDLLKALLISSSNDAAIALEKKINSLGTNFLDLMVEKVKKLKMNDSAFFDSTGLDRKGNFTTAYDLFLLTQEIYRHYPLIGEITRLKETEIYSIDKKEKHLLKNTNELVEKINNLWGGKTGSTPLAGDCLLTVYEFTLPFKNDKIPIGIIVLGSLDRFNDTLKLYEWLNEVLQNSFKQ